MNADHFVVILAAGICLASVVLLAVWAATTPTDRGDE